MFKKIVAVVLVIALTAAASIAGTMAYLQDSDSDVNVMTLGNVQIEQIEQEWNADKTELQPFTQAKPLYPYVGEMGWENTDGTTNAFRCFTMNNVVDKYVSVKNTGKSDAYVRTYIALEMGEFTEAEFNMVGISINAFNGSQFKFDGTWAWEDSFVAEINGENYYVMEAVHLTALKPGETTIPSLLQVYLSKDAGNEEVEKLDGNGNGTYDILVLSQGVQTAGFEPPAATTFSSDAPYGAEYALDTAFGEPEAQNAESIKNVVAWFSGDEFEPPVVLYSYEDTKAVRGENGNYLLGKDINTDNIIHFGNGTEVKLDLNNKTIVAEKKDQFAIGAQYGSKLTLNGNGTVDMGKGFMTNKGDAVITINGGTYHATNTSTLNGMKFNSFAQNNSKIIINDGTFTTNVDDAALFFATSNAIIEVNGGFFKNTADKTPDLFSMGTNKNNTNRIIFKGGTFVNWNPLEDEMCYTGEWPASDEQFSGPWMLVWDGYEVVSETQSNGDVWYTVVKK